MKKGSHLSNETKKKISLALKGKKGHPQTEETKRKISQTRNGVSYIERFGVEKANLIKQRLSQTKKGKTHIAFWGEKKAELWKISIKKKLIGKPRTNEIRKKISVGNKKRFQNPEHKRWRIQQSLKGMIKKPTEFEQKIIFLCSQKRFPFEYVGNGAYLIKSINPDFICLSKKLVIEVYFSLFKQRIFQSTENYEKIRTKILQEEGYEVLFLSEKDINVSDWQEICSKKIKLFIEKGINNE